LCICFVICPSVSCCSSHIFHLCCCYSSGVPCFNGPRFSTMLYKLKNFRKQIVIEYIMCILIVSTVMCETFVILRGIQRDIITNLILILIYLLTAIGLSPGGSSTVQYTERHKTNNTQNNTTIWESAGRAPSWLVIPWHVSYN